MEKNPGEPAEESARDRGGYYEMILRVFPKKTAHTPRDNYARIGPPELWDPIEGVKEVHVSVLFTWWREYAEKLKTSYAALYKCPVKIGGPGCRTPSGEFIPGRYVKKDIAFFSRGCPNKCPWCVVPEIEGDRIIELKPRGKGHIIQDNNLLAVSRKHFERVVDYLKPRHGVKFVGGFEPRRLTSWHVEQLLNLRIYEIWLGCDTDGGIREAKRAITLLRDAGFRDKQIRVYTLIGFTGTLESNEERCREILGAGAYPFAQLYQPLDGSRRVYDAEWRALQKSYCRPAAMYTIKNKG